MNCQRCDAPVTDDAKFCPRCGAPLLEVSKDPLPIPPRLESAARQFVGRVWALRRIVDWLEHGSERLFLLTGAPGSGKSTLTAWLAGAGPSPDDAAALQALRAVRRSWGAMHFCMLRGRGGSIDPRQMTQSLARQLAHRYDEFAETAVRGVAPQYDIHVDVRENWGQVVGVLTRNLIIMGANAAEVYTVAVREPLRMLLESRPDLRVLIGVDGLDEALTPTVPNIVTLLAGSGDLPEGVRFLMTTRNERRVIDSLESRFDDIQRLDLSADEFAAENRADIRAYVTARLQEHAVGSQLNSLTSAETVMEHLVHKADGNFLYVDVLLDEIAAGKRSLAELSALPQGLYGLYRAYLDRIMPEMVQYGGSEIWLNRYSPLLGSLSVAVPAAPQDRLPAWLRWDKTEVLARIDDVEQIVEFDPRDGGGYRVYHRSMADFLTTDTYPDNVTLRPNRYYVSPQQQHDRIVRYYLTSVREEWGGDWRQCDGYGLQQLARHMQARLRLASQTTEQKQYATELYALLLDPGFRAAQQALGYSRAAVDDAHAVLEIAFARHDLDEATQLLAALAGSKDIELRGLAADGLRGLHEHAPEVALSEIKRLLALDSKEAWGVGLKAAYLIGPGANEIFRWVAVEGSTALRQAASYALYLRWTPEPGNLTSKLLKDLAGQISLTSMRKTQRVLELLGDLSITLYMNHCEMPEVITQTSELWYEVLKRRLRLDVVNRPALERLLIPIVANVYSRRVLETALFTELQEPEHFFEAAADAKALFRRVIDLVDPARDVRPHADDLAVLLGSEIALFRFLAALVLGIHSYASFPALEGTVRELFAAADARGRLWMLFAFAILLPDRPPAWLPLLEGMTRRFVEENRTAFVTGASGTTGTFDIALLPLGLAYGKAGGSMPYLEGLIRDSLAGNDHVLVRRCIEALGPVGFYYPEAVFRVLRQVFPAVVGANLEESLVTALAIVRVLHFDAVDVFLRQEGAERLQSQVSARSEVELVRRYIAWIGFHNNAVHQAVNYPKMRRQLLMDGLAALSDARTGKEFIRAYTPVPIQMLREADYRLVQWTLPD